MAQPTYKPRACNLSGLSGISDHTLEMHFGLYRRKHCEERSSSYA